MQKKHPLQKVEQNFSPAENSFLTRGDLGNNALMDNLRKKSVYSKRDGNTAQGLEFVSLENLEVAYPPKRKARTKRCTTSSMKIERSARKSSNGSCTRHRSEISAAELPETENGLYRIV